MTSLSPGSLGALRTVIISAVASLLVAAVGAAYATERSRIDRMEARQTSQDVTLVAQGQDIAVIKVTLASMDSTLGKIERKIDHDHP